MAKKQGKIIKLFYLIGEIFNIGSTLMLVYLIFIAPITETNIRIITFLIWLNLSSHITSRTKTIQSNEEAR